MKRALAIDDSSEALAVFKGLPNETEIGLLIARRVNPRLEVSESIGATPLSMAVGQAALFRHNLEQGLRHIVPLWEPVNQEKLRSFLQNWLAHCEGVLAAGD